MSASLVCSEQRLYSDLIFYAAYHSTPQSLGQLLQDLPAELSTSQLTAALNGAIEHLKGAGASRLAEQLETLQRQLL